MPFDSADVGGMRRFCREVSDVGGSKRDVEKYGDAFGYNDDMHTSEFITVSNSEYETIASTLDVDVPVEQRCIWDAFDAELPGRAPWGHLVWMVDEQPRALISLTHFQGRGFVYLWAKKGPVWIGESPTPEEERIFRTQLVAGIRARDSRIAFVRLHALYEGSDMHELLQSVTYDYTAIVDVANKTGEEIIASFRKRGRKNIRQRMRVEGLRCSDETENASTLFPEIYPIMEETGEHSHFGVNEQAVYEKMLSALGPEYSRLFVAWFNDEPIAWTLAIHTPKSAYLYYGAASAKARELGATDLLDYFAMLTYAQMGVQTVDMMGVDSPRAPQLAGVGGYKRKFVHEDTPVAPAWDVPVRPAFYKALKFALHAKRATSGALRKIAQRARKRNRS